MQMSIATNYIPLSRIGKSQQIATWLGLATSTIGAMVILGWLLNIPTIIYIHPTLAAMQPSTATGFILTGCSLVLAKQPSKNRIGLVCATLALLIASVTISQYVFNWQLPFIASHLPGTVFKMSFATAINMSLISVAFILIYSGKNEHIAQIMLGISLIITLLALLVYFYGSSALYEVSLFSTLALHTSICFLLVGSGGLLIQPTTGWIATINEDSSGGQLLRTLLPATILIPFSVCWLTWYGEQVELYNPAFGQALVTIVNSTLMIILVIWAAIRFSSQQLIREQLNESLKSSEARYESIIQNALDAVITINDQLEIVVYNKVAADIFQYAEGDIINQPFITLFPQRFHNDITTYIERLQDDRQTPPPLLKQLVGKKQNGQEFHIEMTLFQVSRHEMMYITIIVQDVSVLKQQEQDIKNMSLRLAETEELERKHLAEDIHDKMGQRLSLINIHLNLIKTNFDLQPGHPLLGHIETVESIAQDLSHISREIMDDLYPTSLGEWGLAFALSEFATRLTANVDLHIKVVNMAPVHLPLAIERILYRIAQEALVNVVKHAQASHAKITIEGINNVYALIVKDNGIGFNVQDEQQQSLHGLAIMRERALSIGGEFHVESQPGNGTHIYVIVSVDS